MFAAENSPARETQAAAFAEAAIRGDVSAYAERMIPQVKAGLTPAALKRIAAGLASTNGEFKSTGKTRAAAEAGHDVVYVELLFEKSPAAAKVVFDREGRIAGFFFVPAGAAEESPAPPYADPAKFTEEETEVVSGDIRLPALLTLPKEGKNFPAVVLVHGSGPNDKDESIGPNKIFRDLAWGLASLGVASLRYDKRTLAAPRSLDLATLTVKEEVIDDAIAAARLLAADPRIDKTRLILLGHSLGGCLAPRIVEEAETQAGGRRHNQETQAGGPRHNNADAPAFAAIVIMAGSNRPLPEMIEEQMNHIFMEDGKIDAAETRQLESVRAGLRAVNEGKPGPAMLGGVRKIYLDDLAAYDPLATAARLTIPIFVAQGGRDYQVNPQKDFANWKSALADKPNVTLRLYPDLNHLFIPGEGISYPSEYAKPGNVSGEFIGDLAQWIFR